MRNSAEASSQIAVFGSAFNPPSLGHKDVIGRLSHFDHIFLVPSISHAWGKDMLDYKIRCDMVSLFIRDLDMPNVHLSGVEESLYQRDNTVTTYEVLSKLQQDNPQAAITFVLGPDNFFKFHQFFNAQEILRRWAVFCCPQQVNIRSTHIRDKIKCNEPIAELTTPSVASYIEQHQLYR